MDRTLTTICADGVISRGGRGGGTSGTGELTVDAGIRVCGRHRAHQGARGVILVHRDRVRRLGEGGRVVIHVLKSINQSINICPSKEGKGYMFRDLVLILANVTILFILRLFHYKCNT